MVSPFSKCHFFFESLIQLAFLENPIDEEGAIYLANSLRWNNTLMSLKLSNNFSKETRLSILNQLRKNAIQPGCLKSHPDIAMLLQLARHFSRDSHWHKDRLPFEVFLVICSFAGIRDLVQQYSLKRRKTERSPLEKLK